MILPKSMRVALAASLGLVAVFSVDIRPVAAAANKFCRSYADTASFQHGQNISRRCGYAGARWHSWWGGHYSWCRGNSSRRVFQEQMVRSRMLRACR